MLAVFLFQILFQIFGFGQSFPGKSRFSEVPVRRRFKIDRRAQTKRFYNRVRAQVKLFHNYIGDFSVRKPARAESIDENRNGTGNAYCVSHLQLDLVAKPRRNKVFANVPRHIRRRTVNLSRVLAGKSPAAVRAPAAVSIDDNFSARKSAVALGSADFEPARRVNEKFSILYKLRGSTEITCFVISSLNCSCVTFELCCAETTIASTRTGLFPSYSTVTCVFPSGRR